MMKELNANTSVWARRRAGGTGGVCHNVGELLGQDCGESIWDAFDKLVQFEMNRKCAAYVAQGKGYEFDANAEEIRLGIEEKIQEVFTNVFVFLGRNPEWIYKVESLFKKLYDESSVEHK